MTKEEILQAVDNCEMYLSELYKKVNDTPLSVFNEMTEAEQLAYRRGLNISSMFIGQLNTAYNNAIDNRLRGN